MRTGMDRPAAPGPSKPVYQLARGCQVLLHVRVVRLGDRPEAEPMKVRSRMALARSHLDEEVELDPRRNPLPGGGSPGLANGALRVFAIRAGRLPGDFGPGELACDLEQAGFVHLLCCAVNTIHSCTRGRCVHQQQRSGALVLAPLDGLVRGNGPVACFVRDPVRIPAFGGEIVVHRQTAQHIRCKASGECHCTIAWALPQHFLECVRQQASVRVRPVHVKHLAQARSEASSVSWTRHR